MKALCLLSIFALVVSCNENRRSNGWSLVDVGTVPDSLSEKSTEDDTLYDFHLIYCVAGLGSNMGKKMQFFEIKDSLFVFSMRQNSKLENVPEIPADTLETGIISQSLRDSILVEIENSDTIITRRNLRIENGVLISLNIQHKEMKWVIQMHNAYDKTADHIVQLLNQLIHVKERLFVPANPAMNYHEDDLK